MVVLVRERIEPEAAAPECDVCDARVRRACVGLVSLTFDIVDDGLGKSLHVQFVNYPSARRVARSNAVQALPKHVNYLRDRK